MFVVTKDGHRLSVNNGEERRGVPLQEMVGLYSDRACLRPGWILELNKMSCDGMTCAQRFSMDCVKTLRFDHEPTENEVLWAMSAYGLGQHDPVFIRKGLELGLGKE